MNTTDKVVAATTGLKELIATDDTYTIGALLKLYSYQNADEQAMQGTEYQNGVGFNRLDAPFLSNISRQYISKKFLTPAQIMAVRKSLMKYVPQLEAHGGVTPMPNMIAQPAAATVTALPTASLQERDAIQWIRITFPYSGALVTKVKTLSSRKFHAEDKSWTAALSILNVQSLKGWGFTLDQKLTAWYNAQMAVVPAVPINEALILGDLYPFQREGLDWLQAKHGRGLLADEMGLGKTIQALAWLNCNPDVRPVIVVAPASLKLNWLKEAKKWIPNEEITVVSGTEQRFETIPGKILIVNYDILPQRVTCPVCAGQQGIPCRTCHGTGTVVISREDLPKAKAVILDEAHAIKNSKALRTTAVQHLCKGVPNVMALTGTPILNRPIELYNVVHLLNPYLFPSYMAYARRYCGASHNGYGWNFSGASNTQELNEILTTTIMLRRLKADVLRDLPPKQRSFVPMEMESMRAYKVAEADFIAWLRGQGRYAEAQRASQAEALTRIEGLKQLAVAGKFASVTNWIDDFLESGKKLVVFAVHKAAINSLMNKYGDKAVVLDGSTTPAQRQAVVDAFQNDPNIRLFIGNIQAAGVGITLTAADSVAFIELPWTPGAMVQAEDRIHRIGQTAESVSIYYLLAAGTIEEEIAAMLDAKSRVLSQVLDGREVDNNSLLSELIARFT